MQEHTLYPAPDGFTDVPDVPYFAIKEDGTVWNKRSNIKATVSIQDSGYRTVALQWLGKTKTHYVHRMLGQTFHPIPERLKDVLNLEVNHIDCDLANNTRDNVEWTTPKRNIRHAFQNGRYKGKELKEGTDELSDISQPVQARNIKTGAVVVYASIHSCASMMGVHHARLTRHLDSDRAGYVTKNWCVFRKESKDPWPAIPSSHYVENRWTHPNGFWVAISDDGLVTASNLPDLSKHFNIALHLLQYNVKADGQHYNYQGIDFWYDDYPDKEMMQKAPGVKKIEVRAAKMVLVTDLIDGTAEVFESMKKVSKALECNDSSLIYAVQRKNGVYKNYKLEYVH